MESPLRTGWVLVLALALTGCFDRSVSGMYVAKGVSDADLMQLTQSPDGKLVGSLQHVSLKTNGSLETDQFNVSGAVDGHNLTLTVAKLGLPFAQNISGAVSASGLDLSVAGNTGAAVLAHYDRGSVDDFNSAVERLTLAGQSTKAQKVHADQVDALDRSALALEQSLNAFVTKAKRQIDETPGAISYFTRASKNVGEGLQRAQRMASGGNDDRRRFQADAILNQVLASELSVRNKSDSIDQSIEDMRREEASLNVRITAFTGNCLGQVSTVKPGDAIPDMGPCRGLEAAAARFSEVKGPVHAAHDQLQHQKVEEIRKLEGMWQAANRGR